MKLDSQYTREDVEGLIADWERGPSWETVDARTDLLLARAMLPEPQRMTLYYLCSGLTPKDIAQRLMVSRSTAGTLIRDTLANLVRKMNGGHA